jgi:hypothetical protein
MMDFETICYLQNPKTGCTYVAEFLRVFCSDELKRYNKHKLVLVPQDKFYFMNVREPLDLYVSLFNFGLDSKGGVQARLIRAGRGDLYEAGIEGFEPWLEFVLDESNSELLDSGYTADAASQVGLASYRFLRLACPVFAVHSSHFRGGRILEVYEERRIVDAIIRFERLADDLAELVEGPLRESIRDVPAALEWLRDSHRINPSSRRDRPAPGLGQATIDRLREREWPLYELFYPAGPVPGGVTATPAAE